MIKSLTIDHWVAIATGLCVFSHLLLFYLADSIIEDIRITKICWIVNTIIWIPLVFYHFWMITTHFKICQNIWNFLFYWRPLNPYFANLFLVVEKKYGIELAPFYWNIEKELKGVEYLNIWKGVYKNLVIDTLVYQLESEKKTALWYNVLYENNSVFLNIVEKKVRILENEIARQNAFLNRIDAVFDDVVKTKRPVHPMYFRGAFWRINRELKIAPAVFERCSIDRVRPKPSGPWYKIW